MFLLMMSNITPALPAILEFRLSGSAASRDIDYKFDPKPVSVKNLFPGNDLTAEVEEIGLSQNGRCDMSLSRLRACHSVRSDRM